MAPTSIKTVLQRIRNLPSPHYTPRLTGLHDLQIELWTSSINVAPMTLARPSASLEGFASLNQSGVTILESLLERSLQKKKQNKHDRHDWRRGNKLLTIDSKKLL